jgi:hypothetical protein
MGKAKFQFFNMSGIFKVLHFEILLLTLTALLFSSCTEFLSGKPKANDSIEIQSQLSDCLNDVPTDIKNFLDSKAGGEVLDRTVLCIDDTLTKLQTKVEGRQNADAFSADEVYDLVSTFVKGSTLSREGAKNLISLKAALLGGDKTRITKGEINDLKTYLGIIRDEAKKLIPYILVFRFEKSNKLYSKEFIKEAFGVLNSSIKVLAKASSLAGSNYTFSDFRNFLVNVLNLQGQEKNTVEILTQVNYVLNGYALDLDETEKGIYVDNLTEFLRLVSVQANDYVNFDIEDLDTLDDMIEYIQEGIKLIQNSLQYRRTGVVSVNSLDHLMLALSQSDMFTYKVRASSLINFYKTIFVRMFENGIDGNKLNFTGIKPVNILNIRREIAIYQIYTRFLKKAITADAIAAGNTAYDLKELQRVIGSYDIWAESDILSQFDDNTQFIIYQVVTEMRNEFLSATPLVYNRKKLGVAVNQNDWKQTLPDLTKGLVNKMFSRLIMLGYGSKYQVMNQNSNTITEYNMYLWYSEFKALFVDFKSFDPRTANGGSAFFKVANLFTHAGNGDAQMSFRELHENLSILISGGPSFDEIYTDLGNVKCLLPELDIFDKNWGIESCFETLLDENYKRYYSHLPHLVQYLSGLTPDARKAYFHKITNVSRISSSTEGIQVESSDIRGLNSVLYFIEELFIVNDTDKNGKFSEAEIRTAYPKFKSVATDFAEQSSKAQLDQFTSWEGDAAGFGCYSRDDLIRESFIFLAYNGRLPALGDFNILPCLTGKPLMTFKGEIDRDKTAAVFKSLRSVLAPQ